MDSGAAERRGLHDNHASASASADEWRSMMRLLGYTPVWKGLVQESAMYVGLF